MITENNHEPPGLATLTRKLAETSLGALGNRGELLALEWQEEKGRLLELLVWGLGVLFLAIMAMVLLTGTIIFLFPEDKRLYVAGGFTVLYLLGAVAAAFTAKSLLKKEPFSESIEQVKKDRVWLESLK